MRPTPALADLAKPPALFTAQGLGYAHGQQALLSDLSFTINPGLSLVLGGDGRGKSTLLRLIAAELAPQSGVVQRRAQTLYFENLANEAHDGDVAHAWLAARQARFASWRAEVAAQLVQAFGLVEHLAKPLYMLSTGSRRKVGLVAAAASGAQLTLLDSPYAALDARSCQVLEQLLAEAAMGLARAWVMADYTLPAGLADVPLAGVIDLGD